MFYEPRDPRMNYDRDSRFFQIERTQRTYDLLALHDAYLVEPSRIERKMVLKESAKFLTVKVFKSPISIA